MSAINALTGGSNAAGGTSRFTELTSEEFIKIIFTELQNQDPFKPNDSAALLEQLQSIRSIESDMELSKQLEGIVFQNQLASAGNLIGKRVAGLTADNERIGGTVKSVARNGEEIALVLDNGWVLPMENVEYIDQLPAPTGSGNGNGNGNSGGTNPPAGNNGNQNPTVSPTNVLGNWGNSGSNASATDLNEDGKIDATDLALALGG
jgi:flagellar basal-body rod modification protein FlgD